MADAGATARCHRHRTVHAGAGADDGDIYRLFAGGGWGRTVATLGMLPFIFVLILNSKRMRDYV